MWESQTSHWSVSLGGGFFPTQAQRVSVMEMDTAATCKYRGSTQLYLPWLVISVCKVKWRAYTELHVFSVHLHQIGP